MLYTPRPPFVPKLPYPLLLDCLCLWLLSCWLYALICVHSDSPCSCFDQPFWQAFSCHIVKPCYACKPEMLGHANTSLHQSCCQAMVCRRLSSAAKLPCTQLLLSSLWNVLHFLQFSHLVTLSLEDSLSHFVPDSLVSFNNFGIINQN